MFENLSAVLSSEYRIVQATEMKKSVCNKKYTVSSFYKYCSLTPFFLALTHILSYFFKECITKVVLPSGRGRKPAGKKGRMLLNFMPQGPAKLCKLYILDFVYFKKGFITFLRENKYNFYELFFVCVKIKV